MQSQYVRIFYNRFSDSIFSDLFIASLNPTWIIIGGFAGGLTALGFFAFMISVYICYANSRRRIESSSDISTDQDNIPLYTVSSF
jgi:hypothetical protein